MDSGRTVRSGRSLPPRAPNMDRLIALSYRVARAGTWFGCALLIAASFLIGIDVVIRKLFNLSIGGADELSGYALGIASAWAFAYGLLERAHVRIDSLYVTLPRWVRATSTCSASPSSSR